MSEDSWMTTMGDYFVKTHASDFDMKAKDLTKVIDKYNKFIQNALLDESPYVAEDLKLTILQAQVDAIKAKYKERPSEL